MAVWAQVNSAARARPRARISSPPSQALEDGRGDRVRVVGVGQRAAPPAVSGIALRSEVTTGQPQAMASRIVRPNVSLWEGYTKTSAAR